MSCNAEIEDAVVHAAMGDCELPDQHGLSRLSTSLMLADKNTCNGQETSVRLNFEQVRPFI